MPILKLEKLNKFNYNSNSFPDNAVNSKDILNHNNSYSNELIKQKKNIKINCEKCIINQYENNVKE